MTYVRGTSGNDDARAVDDPDGSHINTGAGDDILRGGVYDDLIVGGSGNDQYWGGGGGDEFRFFGTQIEGSSDTDKVYDLNFKEGDTLLFGDFYPGTFQRDYNVNSFDNGDSAIVNSWFGVVNAVNVSNLVSASKLPGSSDTLLLSIDNGAGQSQHIEFVNGWSQYLAAGGDSGVIYS
ncbi:calcium-binding protein [Methylorubrum extorquens]